MRACSRACGHFVTHCSFKSQNLTPVFFQLEVRVTYWWTSEKPADTIDTASLVGVLVVVVRLVRALGVPL